MGFNILFLVNILIIIILFVLYPFYCYGVGYRVISLAPIRRPKILPARYYILLGLLVSNLFLLMLKNFGASWIVATVIIWLLPIPFIAKNVYQNMKCPKKFGINFIIYSILNLIIGVSIFDLDDGIRTYWPSNYGDLAYHFGMITSFVWGENFPPEYHIFAGHKLSYPLVINFWTASFWWIDAEWLTLKYVFLYQWIFNTSLLYGFLRGDKYKFLPWVVLLGGGVYLRLNHLASQLIDANLPWTGFLETIWVPQRSALLGAICLIAALPAILKLPSRASINGQLLFFSILIIFCLPLVHTHTWIIASGVTVMVLLGQALRYRKNYQFLFPVLVGLMIIACSTIFIFYLGDKTSVIKVISGWKTGTLEKSYFGTIGFLNILNSAVLNKTFFWLVNAGNIILIYLILVIRSKAWQSGLFALLLLLASWLIQSTSGSTSHLILFVFILGLVLFGLQQIVSTAAQLLSFVLIFFIFGNVIKLAYWNYDQIKIFIPVYLLIIVCWQLLIPSRSRLNLVLIILILPGIYRLGLIAVNGKHSQVYSSNQLDLAKKIRQLTPPKAIIAAKPLHNSTITLTGRKLYLGYTGTLWTHGLSYKAEQYAQKKIMIKNCQLPVCPDYIFYEPKDQYWREAPSPEGFRSLGSNIYQVLNNAKQ